jgi:uncharacterized protein involved in high-affinity Fe2+ transport
MTNESINLKEIKRLRAVIDAYVELLEDATGWSEGDLIGFMSAKVEEQKEREESRQRVFVQRGEFLPEEAEDGANFGY